MLKTKDIDHKVVIKHFSIKTSLWTENILFLQTMFVQYI